MAKLQFVLFLSILFITLNAYALSPAAMEGKKLYPACHVCHNQTADPPLGPPMWGVQRRYNKNSLDNDDFIESMVNFVKAPTIEKSIHDVAVGQLGLMPPMPLPDSILKQIATYILEETFPPPCEHWKIAVQRATKNDDLEHAQKDQRMLQRFCQ
ncbi:MAG: hypothetical protein QM504_15840 [Pseudomonadota bacterium]